MCYVRRYYAVLHTISCHMDPMEPCYNDIRLLLETDMKVIYICSRGWSLLLDWTYLKSYSTRPFCQPSSWWLDTMIHVTFWVDVWWFEIMTSPNGNILLALCEGNLLVTDGFPCKGQWRRALMFSLIYAWTNSWANNRDADDLRRRRSHYDITIMFCLFDLLYCLCLYLWDRQWWRYRILLHSTM